MKAAGWIVFLAALLTCCAYKVPGPTSTTQGNLVVTDSLRVGTSTTARGIICSGDLTVWDKAQIQDSLRVGTSTVAAPTILAGTLDIWGTTTFHGSTNLGGGALTGTGALAFDLTSVSYDDETITVTSAVAGTPVAVGAPVSAMENGVLFFAWVSSAGVVTVRALRTCDATPGTVTGTFKVTVQ